jgi:hypothetical protein
MICLTGAKLHKILLRIQNRRGANVVLVGQTKGNDHMEDVGVGGKIILKCILKKMCWGMDCFDLSQDRYR